MKNFFKNLFWGILSFIKKHKIISIIIAIILILTIVVSAATSSFKKKKSLSEVPVFVERRDIEETITGSSVIEPNAEYSIIPLVTGEILEAPFEEGDYVNKGDLMYQFDAETAELDLKSAKLSSQRSQNAYENASSNNNDLYIRSDFSGKIQTIYVKEGNNINAGTKIADLYNDDYLTLKLPFNDADANNIRVGDNATVTLTNSGATLYGAVSNVGSATFATEGYMQVRYVTIDVKNPGAVMAGDTATAMINGYACNNSGVFTNMTDIAVIANASGKVERINFKEGDFVSANQIIAVLSSTAVSNQLSDAQIGINEAEIAGKKVLKKLEDYTITAPISGTVVTKNKKKGDKYEGATSMAASASATGTSASSNALAVIYDMSSLVFDLNVDELDVKKVSKGQEVVITVEAADGEYHGVVENVSINGTTGTNGVTTYPVKVRITDQDDNILPGMNIEAKIILSSATNVLAIPASALNRGDIVYVRGEKTDDKDDAPEGFKSTKVKTGASDGDYIEIISGLSEGDEIYMKQASSALQLPQGGGMNHGGMMPPGGGGGK